MKYTILGFQQEKLLDMKLTTDDALLLNCIKDMYGSATMEFKDFSGVRYMWINYTWLLKQIPILGSKRKLMDRIKKYSDEDLLLRVLEKEKKGVRGNYAYISPTKKLFELQDYTPYAESAQGLCKDSIRVMQNLHNKDTSIKDTPIKDNNTVVDSSFKQEIAMKLKIHKLNIEPTNIIKLSKGDIEGTLKRIDYFGHKGAPYLLAAIRDKYDISKVVEQKKQEDIKDNAFNDNLKKMGLI